MQDTSRIALVTGATRGIGLHTVRQLAEAGVHTLLAGRDRAKAVEAALKLQAEGLPVEAITLDVTDDASIAGAVGTVEARHGRLDILVNNAGILVDEMGKKVSEQTAATWRKTFDTNVFGLIAVTQAFLPLLHKSSSGRIVNVSSILGSVALNADPSSPIYDFKVPAYNVSKSAVNAWTVQLAYELRDSRIKVNTIHPGYVKTDMNAGEGELEIADGARTSVALALIDDNGPQGGFFYQGEVLPW
ncbi:MULTISPECIES: SDR family oxidoreductase [Pseudoxanthomonas]|jgi:NAD(P)-dependent dehydrogenase (short-subunit alcohol dehydrogenase family)|uniref:SDR family oxidoreductase n=1 Tax=Pseudoxanthomonas TaxID=83618 RepID=UPI0016225FA1|nr:MULTISPECIES: SDR family oxidoreductase [Pseudoxanthomonas]MBB3277989.1 NAD(P)-dependent dehydrogenase (short-subunit alcohol dehydrogenase family) [Pseudoxanthomonas sp. OG2]MBD9375783.1 SDR family oxidoreductase [Pseudoxanthomonas sp. PXM04]MBV7474658.1 SDR family oxidoreductase [Pseudoxanthomonas sp. PXM05]